MVAKSKSEILKQGGPDKTQSPIFTSLLKPSCQNATAYLIPLALCSHPIKMLHNFCSGTQVISQTVRPPVLAENKAFIFKLLSLR